MKPSPFPAMSPRSPGLQSLWARCGALLALSGLCLAQPVVWEDSVDIQSPFLPITTGDITGVATTDTSFTVAGGGYARFDVTSREFQLDDLADYLHLRYERLTGDFDRRVRLTAFELLNPTDPAEAWARAGLMVRESLDPNSTALEIFAANPSGANVVRVAGRGFVNQNYSEVMSRSYPGVDTVLPNQWLRVRRVGNAFAFFLGSNGTDWTLIAEHYQNFSETVYFGTFASPDNAFGTTVVRATFSDYGPPSIEDSTAPQLVSVGTIDRRLIGVKFSEPVSSGPATNPENYTLSEGTVTGAQMGIGGNTVYLHVTGLDSDAFTVTVTGGIEDLAGNALPTPSSANGRVSHWISTDIGYIQDPENRPTPGDDPYLPGRAVAVSSHTNPEVEIVGGGSNAWNPGDFIHYLYREYTGDFDVVVAVERFDRRGFAGGFGNAGIHVRAGLYRTDTTAIGEATQVPNYVNVTYYEASAPGRSAIEIRRMNAGEGYGNSDPYGIAHEINGVVGYFGSLRGEDAAGNLLPNTSPTAARWLRVTRVGQTFTSFFSYDGENWVQQNGSQVDMPSMPSTVLVGFSNHNDSGFGTPPEGSTYGGNGTPHQNESNYGVLRINHLGDYPIATEPEDVELVVSMDGSDVVLSWTGDGWTLVTSDNPAGPWLPADLAVEQVGEVRSARVAPAQSIQLFRLTGN